MREDILSYFTIILLFASCNSNKQSTFDEMPPLYPAPLTVALNTQEGYKKNLLTGDSIQPIINSLGDTVKTGVSIPARGKVIDPASVVKPRVVPAGNPKVVPVHNNVHKIPENLTVIPVNKDALKTFTPGVDTSSFVLFNSTGDTVPTGVPIPVKGKVVPCRQPQPVKALPPGTKDNAIINLKFLDVAQGMNSSIVFSILEDSHGNFWFGTDEGGVSMYNGETFTHFTQKEGLSNNYVSSILEDSSGNLWFGTFDGVSKYNGETFTHFTEKEGLIHNDVRSIIEDSHGNLWFCTVGGLNMYDGKSFTHFTEREGLIHNTVRSIMEDSNGNLWFGTVGGVSMYNGKAFTHFTEREGLSNNTVRSILEDSKGNLWFGTNGGGVSIYNGKTFTHFTQKEGLSDNDVLSMLEDSYGNFWFGTYGGVSIYTDKTFTHFTQKEGLIHNTVRSIMEDNHGNLWFGKRGGVSMYNGKAFTHFTEKEGLSNNIVLSILKDSHGKLWLGTGNSGVMMYDGKTFTYFTQIEGLSDNNVRSILEDSKGNLWFGTGGGGLSMYNGETFTHFTQKEGLCDDRVRSILEDSQGNLWCGTWGGGVSMYNGETFTHFTQKEGLSDDNVRSILEDSHGNIWFGTGRGGASRYDGHYFTHFTKREGLSDNWVSSILEDNNNNIWLGTRNGLNRLAFDPENFSGSEKSLSTNNPVIHTYSLQDGLKGIDFHRSNVILDSKNCIWWGSINSLTVLDMNNFKITVEPPVMHLNRIDINGEFKDYRHLEDSDEMEIEFNGVAKFNNYPLNLELLYNRNHLTFHFSAIDWSAPHKIRYSYIMEGLDETWSIPTTEAKADYRNMPHGTYTFIVRAIGAAQKWSEPFEYTFTIHPPWWHTLWARAGYGIIAFLLFYGFVRWRTVRLKRSKKELEHKVKERTTEIRDKNEELRQQQEELKTINETLEDQKEMLQHQKEELQVQKEELQHQKEVLQVQKEELQHQKEELQVTLENLKTTQSQLVQSEKMASIGQLVAGIAHEINNPVTFISAGVDSLNTNLEEIRQVLDIYHRITLDNVEEKLKEIEKLKEKIEYNEAIREINKLIESVRTGTERTTEIVKGLRTFSRLDEDVLKMADIHEGLDSTLILLRNKYKERIEIEKHYGDLPEMECYPGQLNQVFMNVLSNAIDAIDNKGALTIRTAKSNGSISISIKDTGKGIPEDIKSRIFEPFFTTKEVGQGTGLGLSICQGIIEKHHGSIEVKSEVGKGSEFVILLPVKQSKK